MGHRSSDKTKNALACLDSELVEVRRLQPEVREMELPEWSQPGLALAAGAEENGEAV